MVKANKSSVPRSGGLTSKMNPRLCYVLSSMVMFLSNISRSSSFQLNNAALTNGLNYQSPDRQERTLGGNREQVSYLEASKEEIRSVNEGMFYGEDGIGHQSYDRTWPCAYIAETNLPTEIGEFRLRAYTVDESVKPLMHTLHFGTDPCVVYAADKPPFGKKGVPVRIHDQCFTSEVFGSRRCDCKEQLEKAFKYVHENGGAVIYLQQEGRGIGLANKIAAYSLQDLGLDTVDANLHLGLPEDCRQYGVVPSILEDMDIESIRLMTNNPRKIEKLEALGVDMEEPIPVVINANPHNRRYLEAKHLRMNHQNFGQMLDFGILPEDSLKDVINNRLGSLGVKARDDGYCFGRKSVEDAIEAVGRGEIVVVVDDMDRENEGDFIMAADLATPETIAAIVRYSSGVICVGMEGERMDELELPAMIQDNQDPKETAFSVTVDASKEHGITTGISAADRATSINLLANPSTKASDFNRPGHIFPLRAKEGGVLTRDGHTEAAVDLSRLAGLSPNGVLCEIVSEENPTEMARLPELERFCKKHGYVLTSIVDIAQYRRETE